MGNESNSLLVGDSSLSKNLERVFIVFFFGGGAGLLCVTSLGRHPRTPL